MKKFLTTLPFIFSLFFSINVYAQPTFIFPSKTATAGETFCIEVKTRDFTNLLKIEKVFTWDPAVVRFTDVQRSYTAGVRGFPTSVRNDFDVSDISNGNLKWSWEELTGASFTIPAAIEDDYVLFDLCFESIGSFGASTTIETAQNPLPCVTRLGSGGRNIGCNTEVGIIGTDVLPVRICPVEDPEPNQGDFFCVDFQVDNFHKIVGFQLTLEYDPSVLDFDGINDLGNLPSFNPRFDFVLVEPGKITGSWFARSGNVTLPDESGIFGACFRAIGDCDDFSFVQITSNLTPIQVYSGEDPDPNAGTNIGFVTKDALVRIQPCDQRGEVTLTAECPDAKPGERVCVKVKADGFENITETDFLIKWNPQVIDFQTIRNLSVYSPTIDQNAANLGTLGVNWKQFPPTGPGISLNNGTDIFEICYDVIGDGTVNSSVSFPTRTAYFTKRGSQNNIGLVASNGCVTVTAPPGITLSAGDFEDFKGERVIVPVTVANFQGVNFAQFSINYNDNFLNYAGAQNFAIASMSNANFPDMGDGNIAVDWDANMGGFGESIPDGDVIFELVFDIIGDPSPTPVPNCAFVQFSNEPQDVLITTENSGTFNVGLNSVDGRICIKDPGFFTVEATEIAGDLGEIVCVDVNVENFNEITSFQFSTTWNGGPFDPVVSFVNLDFPGNVPNFDESNFDVSTSNLGIITMLWNDDTGNGLTLPDGTTIFSVCFEIIGDANNCTTFTFDEEPLEPIVTSTFSGGNNIGLNSDNGEICASDYLRIQDSTVTNVGCPGGNSGSIFLRTGGGTPPYTYNWTGTNQNTEDVDDLPVGSYDVEILDSSVPPRVINASFDIIVSGTAPIANAGIDKGIPCNDQPIILDGTESSAGSVIQYRWFTIDSGVLIAPSDRTSEATVGAEGTYVLEVLNTETNCVSYDTVVVTPPSMQVADAGLDKQITCFEAEVLLNGDAPDATDAFYFWRPIDGGFLDPNTDSISTAVAITPGQFELTVRDRFTGCEGKDTVIVTANDVLPIVDAGPQMSLPCMADTITIGGNNTATGSQYIYEWTEVDGGNIISGKDQRAAEINSIGLYQLEVIDTITGCTNTDTIRIIGDPDIPLADAGPDLRLTCDETQIQIQSSNSSQNGPYAYQWEAFGGGTIPPGEETILQPTISTPGVYSLTVTNTVTMCPSFATVVVTSDQNPPNAFAGADIDIGCKIIDIPVDGQGSSFGPEFTYTWSTNGSGTISNPDSISTILTGAGEFYLNVTNTETGCSAMDTIAILQDTTNFLPEIVIDQNTANITCQNDRVTLNALGSDNGPEYTVAWGPLQYIANGQGTLTPTVDSAGVYTLSILHDSTQCSRTATVEVGFDTLPPVLDIAPEEIELPCSPRQVIISGQVTNPPNAGVMYQWQAPAGVTLPNPNVASTTVNELGLYILTATNNGNGCSALDSVNVIPAPSNIVAEAGNDIQLDCQTTAFDIDGGMTSTGADITYSWTDIATGDEVSTTLNWTVEDEGTYVLLVMDGNGCQKVDTLVVTQNGDLPTVSAGTDQSFTCFFDGATLDGSFDVAGANASFEWTSPDGNPISDPNSLTPTVTQGGTYVLTVFNEDNNCVESAEVMIEVSNVNLEGAEAAAQQGGTCENFAELTANLPADATGSWIISGGDIDDPNSAEALVNNLPNGTNTFIWVLSTPDCPEYSADTIRVNIVGAAGDLLLRNDIVMMAGDQDSTLVEYLLNDDVDATGNWDIEIIEFPTSGQIANETDGSFTYIREAGFAGNVEVIYSVCNVDCMDQCDTAFVRINVEELVVEIPEDVPNAITPNGDGVNDELVFDVLALQPGKYPENELVIFNRWGNVVHKSAPYNNDWQGTGRNGKPLPHATYYYILRLNLSDGEIIRGDVTILK